MVREPKHLEETKLLDLNLDHKDPKFLLILVDTTKYFSLVLSNVSFSRCVFALPEHSLESIIIESVCGYERALSQWIRFSYPL